MTPRKPSVKATGEMKIYGLHACVSLWKHRPEDVIRVYVAEERVRELGNLLKWCARAKKAYHVVDDEALAKVAASVHHEGVCILAKEPKRLGDAELIAAIGAARANCVLFLDGVQNPHNVGSIMRVAAHFGVKHLVGVDQQLPRISPSAARVAEGGYEFVQLADLKDPAQTLEDLRAEGYQIIATSSHEGTSLYEFEFPKKAIVAMGAEVLGISQKLAQMADHHVRIPGTGNVESLNVSVACGLLLGEFYRRHGAKS